jgi:hypothetical protein
MTFLTNITDFENHKKLKDEIILNTNISIDDIKKNINKILDKNQETCKYYINYTEPSWTVSFNVDERQLEAMIETSFEIFVYKDINSKAIIVLTKEIKEHQQWHEIYSDIKGL